MSIKYCSWSTGSDTTGDGTAGTPYKTINKASDGLTGGDEVRVEKSPANTALTGTVSFTQGSQEVVGDGTLFQSELSVLDIIIGADGFWYRIEAINDDESASIEQVYLGITATDFASSKINFIDTDTSGQVASASGVSAGSRLKISGGWDLTSETQTSVTTFSTSDGGPNGFDCNGNNYLELNKINFINYNNNIVNYDETWLYVHNCNIAFAGGYGVMAGANFIGDNLHLNANGDYELRVYAGDVTLQNSFTVGIGIASNDSGTLYVDTVKVYSGSISIDRVSTSESITSLDVKDCEFNGGGGIEVAGSRTVRLNGCTFNNTDCSLGDFGYEQGPIGYLEIKDTTFNTTTISMTFCLSYFENITMDSSPNSLVIHTSSPVVINGFNVSNVTDGLHVLQTLGLDYPSCWDVTINNFVSSGVTNDIVVDAGTFALAYEKPIVKIQGYQTAGKSKCFYAYGTSESNTSEARGGGVCFQMTPTSATFYIAQKFNVKAIQNSSRNIHFYVKKDGSFDGNVVADVYFEGKLVVDGQVVPTTTSYVKQTVSINGVDVTENGVLELVVRARGTTGNIYLDDFST